MFFVPARGKDLSQQASRVTAQVLNTCIFKQTPAKALQKQSALLQTTAREHLGADGGGGGEGTGGQAGERAEQRGTD